MRSALERLRIACGGVVGVAAGVAQGCSLALEVPQHGQPPADRLEARAVGFDDVDAAGVGRDGLLVSQLAHLLLELLDLDADPLVVHGRVPV